MPTCEQYSLYLDAQFCEFFLLLEPLTLRGQGALVAQCWGDPVLSWHVLSFICSRNLYRR